MFAPRKAEKRAMDKAADFLAPLVGKRVVIMVQDKETKERVTFDGALTLMSPQWWSSPFTGRLTLEFVPGRIRLLKR